MLSKVVPIDAGRNQKIVDLARDLLAQAERGEFDSIAYVAERPGGAHSAVGVEGRWMSDPRILLGELSILKARISKVVSERRFG